MHYLKSLLLAFLVVSINLSASSIPAHRSVVEYEIERDVDHLLVLMQKRLSFMHEVARTKWNKRLPISDPEREALMLTAIEQEAEKLNLDPILVREFFKAQITAACEMQAIDFVWYEDDGQSRYLKALDLQSEIRPYLNRLNFEILQAIAKVYPIIQSKEIANYPLDLVSQHINDYITLEVWEMAIAPLVSSSDESFDCENR